ncbi:PAS domain-containing protein [Polyangium jinanense]|uniref:PAS domain-containing protein n=1 Tax=Polyangium jinanense TaxID=2829994 RepID=A0A9X3X9G2_9BACT|nr:PAS domain-containing protein [Polyangium jinanense]MDC3959926.1 PAS domain-containing protein [Polyangium jinanense]MDC3983806.1 PAS domain-containing protein [Polyangium jinanense]
MTQKNDSPSELASELARAKQRIAELEAQLAAEEAERAKQSPWIYDALSSAGIGVWTWDIPRDVITWTDTVLAIYGLTRETFGSNMTDFMARVHPDDQHVVQAAVARVFTEREPSYRVEHRVVRPDGELRWVRGTGYAYHDANGKPYRLAGVTEDITERIREQDERCAMQQQVIDAQRESLRQLGAPIIPLTRNALAMPLVGTLTAERATLVTETLLQAVTERAAEHVILDVTGVPSVDNEVADGLLRVAQAVRLLGAEVALTGMQPAVAQALVELGVDMSTFVTKADLQSGIRWASKRAQR